ncbi:ribose-5-phosphate isomerase RpiA [Alicyclobacillus fodiniaquatilis]|uniref:Ribose-5-phosphate isomerase A n=1 Tax=Alicyclobacillus fodiniaquatilis TaxID=1661150 RepID=A0ABW4JBB2_9BACL
MANDAAKKLAGEHAATYVEDGMMVGLGTGSTAFFAIQALGERVANGLNIQGVATSKDTEVLAQKLHIPLLALEDVPYLDMALDGADEVDEQGQLIKGGGGALLREKLVASAAKKFIVIVDASKEVKQLGAFPLPVEIVPFAWEKTAQKIADLDCHPVQRQRAGKPFITDNGNYIVDCHCEKIEHPAELHQQLKLLTGVVETGLFIDMASVCVTSDGQTTRVRDFA